MDAAHPAAVSSLDSRADGTKIPKPDLLVTERADLGG